MKCFAILAASLTFAISAWARPEPRSVFAAPAVRDEAGCVSAGLDLTESDRSIEFGQYGTLFLESGLPQCRQAAHDMLLQKLRVALAKPRRFAQLLEKPVGPFSEWLAGGDIGLIIAAAMRLGGAGLLDAPLDLALRSAIGAYEFNLDPTCGLNFSNGCMDDYTQAAVGYAWIAAYAHKSGQEVAATRAAAQARILIGRSLSLDIHMCKVASDESLPSPCSSIYGIASGLETGYHELVSFNHGFEDVAYGIGLIPSISSAAIALEEAGMPMEPAFSERFVAWALFREGARATLPDGSAFRTNCYRVADNSLLRNSECADAWNLRDPSDPLYNPWFFYLPRMFPVRAAYRQLFQGTPDSEPFRFDDFDPSLFNNPFLNDGRKAVYGVLGYAWWNDGTTDEVRPLLDGYHGPDHRDRATRH